MSQLFLRKLTISLAMLVIVGCSAAIARADTVTYQLNVGSTLPANQNYGTVTLTLVGSSIKVDIALIDGNKIVNTGFDASVAFNQAGNTNAPLTITGLPGTYSVVNGGVAGALGMDGFGNFEYGVLFNSQGGGAGTDSTLSFTVSRAGGFSSVFSLVELSTNPPGSIESFFGVDIICPTCPGGATGVVGTNGHTVPEPATMVLLGTGLLAVAGTVRRRFRK